jgi:hypothetical protein
VSTFIERLHQDTRGVVASAELILALPLFLLSWILMWEFGVLGSSKVVLAVESRTVAFLDANADQCVLLSNRQEAIGRRATFYPPTCSRSVWSGADRFWSEMDQRGGQSLTGDVRGAQPPRLVTSDLQVGFRFHSALRWPYYDMRNRVTVMTPVRYTNEDPRLTYGYDRALRSKLSSNGSLISLFPNVFRGR